MPTSKKPAGESAESLAIRVTRLEDEFTNVRDDMTGVREDMSKLQLRMGNVENAVERVRTDVLHVNELIQQRFEAHTADLKRVETVVEKIGAQMNLVVTTIQTGFAELTATPAGRDASKELDNVKGRITQLENNVESLVRDSSYARGALALPKWLGPAGVGLVLLALMYMGLQASGLHIAVSK